MVRLAWAEKPAACCGAQILRAATGLRDCFGPHLAMRCELLRTLIRLFQRFDSIDEPRGWKKSREAQRRNELVQLAAFL